MHKLRKNYAEITQKLRTNYAENNAKITQITQITHSENNYAKITQKLRHLEKRQAGQVGISRDIPVQVFENGISQDNLG